MKKIKLLFLSLLCISTLSLTSCGDDRNDLLISEIYEADGSDRALELYNKAEEAISLKNYSLNFYSGTSKTPSYTINLDGQLEANDTYVIAFENAKEATKAKADLISDQLNFNGNQVITLNKGKNIVDIIGNLGFAVNYYENITYVRKTDCLFPREKFDEYDWIRYDKANLNYLGNSNNSVTPEELLAGPKLTAEDYAKPFFADEAKTLGGGGVVPVTVYAYVDGDTTMFNYPSELGIPNGTKVRYQNINTRESYTGNIQEWGIPAKNFTNDCLKKATKIELQSVEDGSIYETFNRVLGWVWIDGELQNYKLALEGYTEDAFGEISSIKYKDIPYSSYIYNGKLNAMKMKKGIWGQKDPYWDYVNNKSIYE